MEPGRWAAVRGRVRAEEVVNPKAAPPERAAAQGGGRGAPAALAGDEEETNDKRISNEQRRHNMPGFDGTGPAGGGPMTGGARGLCNPAAAGYRSGFFGGFGRGWGLGRGFRGGGFRRRFYPSALPYAYDPAAEQDLLKTQASAMQNSLDAINKRLAELEKSST